jgi:hypothetical protein
MLNKSALRSIAVGFLAIGSSILLREELVAQAPQPVIAYEVAAGTVGNQDVNGNALGMDFDVELDILVTRIGVFDSGSDGLFSPITARLYDRDDPTVEVGAVDFTPEDPGDLVGGSRFKEFSLDLPAGFHGSIVASGYNAAELNGNSFSADANPLGLSLNDGGCAILFTGGGRFGSDGVSFPASPDTGPPNRYAAGTFEFIPQEQFPGLHDAIAYNVPAGTLGNQNANAPLGMDFDVNTAILVTRLGVFDSGSDGLAVPLTARIFNRTTQGEIVHLDFTLEDPGELVEGSRFKDLVPPLSLQTGFSGTMVGEGYNDLELNGNLGQPGPPVGLSLDNGGCAVRFVGGGRFGTLLGTFPSNGDSGPPNRYAAGTFEFKIDKTPPPLPPDPPGNLKATGGDGKVDLTWDVSAGVTPAAKYRVFRSSNTVGPFAQVAETTGTQYADSPLPNEVLVCYVVRAVSGGGVESFDSAKKCAVPAGPQPAGRFIAYNVPGGTQGNQAYGGALGMDFDVTADITVTRLGVFDDGSDGLNVPIAARIFDRDVSAELAMIEFLPDDPGVLIAGSRFKALESPLALLAGFHGTIVASGYGGAERNGNQGVGPVDNLTTDDGGCRISYVGLGRFGNDPVGFPGTPDGGPPNRYAAGTFEFQVLGQPIDPTPQPPVDLVVESRGTSLLLSWQPTPASGCTLPASSYKVLRSTGGGPLGEIAQVPDTTYLDSAVQEGVDYCYVVHSLGGGLESGDSAAACASVGRFIAYVVPSGTEGTLVDGLPAGMDFDVIYDVQVTRLGAFDSLGDGLQSNITVRLLNRETEEELASAEFTPADPGALINGSRFKPLTPALSLPAGLKCAIVAEGYGADEPAGTDGPWFTNPGPCSVFFTGTGRSAPGAASLPLPNDAGRPDQYAAGTFEFKPVKLGTPHGAIAYQIPAGTIGNQQHGGTLGHDFNVNVPIKVTRLGVFDSGADGLQRQLTARLYNRDTREAVAEIKFPKDDPGDLVDGSRFKPLDPPVSLPAGFHGTMVGAGYGAGEPNGNSFSLAAGVPWTVDDGGCAITFVGLGRFGALPAVFPINSDAGPANRYAAGTFEFEVEGGPQPAQFHRGDSDNNGQLQLTDAVRTLGYLFLGGVAPTCLDAADSDGNNQLQLTDAVRILGFLFLGQLPPVTPGPPPQPCGPDNDGTHLGCNTYDKC